MDKDKLKRLDALKANINKRFGADTVMTAKEAADKISDELIDDQDDKDIEAIEGEDIPAEDPNIDYDYDDDELIDAVIDGIDL